MRRYSAQVKGKAVRLYESGLSCRAVAEQMKAKGAPSPHYVTVLRWVKETGKGRTQRGRRFPLPVETVRRLYGRGMHADGIARRFHVGTTTIYKRLHEADTKMRPSRVMFGHVLTEARLRKLYIENGWTAARIARKWRCNTGTVYNWLRARRIPLRRPRYRKSAEAG